MSETPEYTSDNDLREKNDNFWIQRIFKFAVLIISIGVMAVLAVWFSVAVSTDEDFRRSVLSTIASQIDTIAVAALIILGIRFWR